MLLPSLTPRCIGQNFITCQTQLGTDKADDLLWDDFTGRQKLTRIAQGAELQGETDPVFGATSFVDVVKVIVGQRVVMQDCRLVGWQVEQACALPFVLRG